MAQSCNQTKNLMPNFWGKIVFIALKKTMEDVGALCYKTAGATLLLD